MKQGRGARFLSERWACFESTKHETSTTGLCVTIPAPKQHVSTTLAESIATLSVNGGQKESRQSPELLMQPMSQYFRPILQKTGAFSYNDYSALITRVILASVQ